MLNSYIIIDSTNKIQKTIFEFQILENFVFLGSFDNHNQGINAVLEKKPELVFLYLNQEISFEFILELQHYIDKLPKIIVIDKEKNNAYKALKYGVFDFILYPLDLIELRMSVFKFNKNTNRNNYKKLCVKSNGDYHFVNLNDIVFLKADNNTTDFYLENGQIIHGFKTMKFYTEQLPFYFFRIHNSYIVNINFVSRITLSKNSCYVLGNMIHKLPFSRNYKENIDLIIKKIS